jgi:murein DD-endopeptidase MepM/ murein hydrolase activator NlpD
MRALLFIPVVMAALLSAPVSGRQAAGCPVPVAGTYSQPVAGVVVDGFRPPETFAGPGNRGWEYETGSGAVVKAAGGGVISFAGQVGGRLVVAIDHPDGLRTTYSWLATISVQTGATVARGSALGTSGGSFHFGVRCGGEYVDPAVLFATAGRGRPHLVPMPARIR